MDKVVLAGVTVFALGIGAFIFWGPNPRPRRRGGVVGLQNLGLTCFLNSLLQATASCSRFVEWLESCHDQGNVASSLFYLLRVLGTERSLLPANIDDPLTPSLLIDALRRHGWSISHGEQDTHELFHLLMVTLEEEAHKAIAAESGLTDALEPRRTQEDIASSSKEDSNQVSLKSKPNSENSVPRVARGDIEVNKTDADVISQNDAKPQQNAIDKFISAETKPETDIVGDASHHSNKTCGDFINTTQNNSKLQKTSNDLDNHTEANRIAVPEISSVGDTSQETGDSSGDFFIKTQEISENSTKPEENNCLLNNNGTNHTSVLETRSASDSSHINSGSSGVFVGKTQSLPSSLRLINKQGDVITRSVAPKYDVNRNYQPSPFCGLLTSQLQCVKCKFKSVLRFDKFDSLSLHLPDPPRGRHTLAQLLDNFTSTEAIAGVACDGCNKGRDPAEPPITSTSLKTLSIGKLSKCLCIHIHRMSMASDGTPYKRRDYVDFPEYLVMDPYTHISMIKGQKVKDNTNHSSEEDCNENETVITSASNSLPCRTDSWHHLYRLKAVVVHNGSEDSGHFVTYRRGPLRSNTRHRSDRWYYTSDDTVQDSTLAEAMNATAYMLFYEKCSLTPT